MEDSTWWGKTKDELKFREDNQYHGCSVTRKLKGKGSKTRYTVVALEKSNESWVFEKWPIWLKEKTCFFLNSIPSAKVFHKRGKYTYVVCVCTHTHRIEEYGVMNAGDRNVIYWLQIILMVLWVKLCPSKRMYGSANHQYLRTWSFLEVRSLQR